jgi:NADH-quinone oxidoreductase subunit J
MHEVLFYLFAALVLVPAILLVASRNTVNGAMLMIVSLVGTASLYAMLQAYLLAVLQIMVYVGAVVVLFVMIVMLIGVGNSKFLRADIRNIAAAGAFFILLAGCPILAISAGRGGMAPAGEVVAPASSASNIVMLLFTKYQLAFELTGFLLLSALVGVIFISQRTQESKPLTADDATEE